MVEEQKLGGTRKSSPLEDEQTYPLNSDEFLTIKDNQINNKFTSWQAFLVSTLVTTVVSGIVICETGAFYTESTVNGVIRQELNIGQVVILVIYGAVSFGALIGLIMTYTTKKKSRPSIDRLNSKIEGHLKLNPKEDE